MSFQDPALHDQDPVRDPLRLCRVVGCHNDHGPAFFSHVLDYGFDDPGVLFIDGRGRLIEEEDLGFQDKGARYAETLGLAARKGARLLAFFPFKSDEGKRLGSPGTRSRHETTPGLAGDMRRSGTLLC